MNPTLTSETERVLILKTIPAFARLDTYSARQLAHLVNERIVRQGAMLLEEGARPMEAYFVPHHTCDVLVGEEPVAEAVGPTSVGLWALLGAAKARCSVRARRDMVALGLGRHIATQIWESNFSLMNESVKSAAGMVVDHRRGLPFEPGVAREVRAGSPIAHPLDLTDKLVVQLDNSFYQQANLEAVAELCRGESEIRLPAGATLWAAGDEPTFFDRIVSGTVEVIKDGESHGEVGVGYALGLFDGLARRPRPYEARASRDVVLLRADIEQFLDLQHDHFELARRMFDAFAAALPAQTAYL